MFIIKSKKKKPFNFFFFSPFCILISYLETDWSYQLFPTPNLS